MMDLISLLPGLIALFIALFIPGYFLCLGFFPGRQEIDWLERVVFSFIFSVTFIPLLILIENRLIGIPVNTLSVYATMLLLVLLGLLFYFIRLGKLGLPEKVHWLLPKVKGEALPLLPWK
jgi:uncharacterized membrane protein